MRVSIVGTGNVAWHLVRALRQAGHDIVAVAGRDLEKTRSFIVEAGLPESAAVMSFADIPENAEIVIIAVSDKGISDVASRLSGFKGVVCHTAASVEIDALKNLKSGYGVLYPLQTFTKGRTLDYSNIPFFIEGSDGNALSVIESVARSISPKVAHLDSKNRKFLHLAGVQACNFVNALVMMAKETVDKTGSQFEILRPLIMETVSKAFSLTPEIAQTGPAARGDRETIDKHLQMLQGSEQQTYKDITAYISKKFNHSSQAKIDHSNNE